VGRTARAGNSGRAITIVTQYDIEILQRIESLIGRKLDEYKEMDEKAALILTDSVVESTRLAMMVSFNNYYLFLEFRKYDNKKAIRKMEDKIMMGEIILKQMQIQNCLGRKDHIRRCMLKDLEKIRASQKKKQGKIDADYTIIS